MVNATLAGPIAKEVATNGTMLVVHATANCQQFLGGIPYVKDIPPLFTTCSWWDTFIQSIGHYIPPSILVLALLTILIVDMKIDFLRGATGHLKWVIVVLVGLVLIIGAGVVKI